MISGAGRHIRIYHTLAGQRVSGSEDQYSTVSTARCEYWIQVQQDDKSNLADRRDYGTMELWGSYLIANTEQERRISSRIS